LTSPCRTRAPPWYAQTELGLPCIKLRAKDASVVP
jgi:hypothetical protein